MITVIRTFATRKCCAFCNVSKVFNLINTQYQYNAVQCDGCRRLISFDYTKFEKEYITLKIHSPYPHRITDNEPIPNQAIGSNESRDFINWL